MSVHIRKLAFWQDAKESWKANSVVVITGAASGIGRKIALIYAARKCRLVLGDISKDALPSIVSECQTLGSEAVGVPVDVTVYEQCQKLVESAISSYGGLDLLVLCAGIGAHHKFGDTSAAQLPALFNRLMQVNFNGYLYCTHAAYPHLRKSKGRLLAITSFSGEVGLPYRTAYCASKFAVTGFLESLRAEMQALGGSKFDITIVCPPTVDSNLRKNSLTTDPNLKDSSSGDAMTVDECAAAVVDAADRRLRKAFFPFKSWAAAYLRPLLPDPIDKKIWARAKL